MKNSVKNFMNNNNLTVRKLAQQIGISKSTLSYDLSKPIEECPYKVLNLIAHVVNTTLSQVVHELQKGGWHLNINDKKHTIQGVYCGNDMNYITTKDCVINQYFEGWQPTSKEIKELIDSANHPDKALKQDMSDYIREAKREGIYLGK